MSASSVQMRACVLILFVVDGAGAMFTKRHPVDHPPPGCLFRVEELKAAGMPEVRFAGV